MPVEGLISADGKTVIPNAPPIPFTNDGTSEFSKTIAVTYPVPPCVTINDVSHTEGNAGQKSFAFTVTRTGDLSSPSSVAFATHGVTASAGSDYVGKTGTVNFVSGQATASITVLVNGDTTVESDETFHVDLTNPVNAIIKDSEGVGTIINDDFAVSTKTATFTGNEGRSASGTVASFTSSNASAPGSEFSASINWGDGSSGSGSIVSDGSGKFHVTGTHAYHEESTGSGYAVTVTIHDNSGPTKVVNSLAKINPSPLDQASGLSLSKLVNTTYTNLTLGSFRDQDALNTNPTDYKATIDWGDASAKTSGKLVFTGAIPNNGSFWNVQGTHKYTAKKTSYTVTITVIDTASPGMITTITTTIKIS